MSPVSEDRGSSVTEQIFAAAAMAYGPTRPNMGKRHGKCGVAMKTKRRLAAMTGKR